MKRIIKVLIASIFLIYISYSIVRILFPVPQFHIVMDDYFSKSEISVFTYQNCGTEYQCKKDGDIYSAEVLFDKENYFVKIIMDNDSIKAIFINDNKMALDDVHIINNLTLFEPYKDIIAVTMPFGSFPRNLAVVIFVFLLGGIGWALNIPNLFGKFFDRTILSMVGHTPIALSFLVAVFSAGIYYGCDIDTILGTINLWQSGLDIYQLQSSMDSHYGITYLMWPYNCTMLIFYDIALTLNRFLIPILSNSYTHFIQLVLIKLVNMSLLNITVISILTYLFKRKVLKKESVKSIYYWSIFNPLTLWISIIFIQLDIFPVCCLAIGLLFMDKLRENCLVSTLFLSIGICAKSQQLLYIPVLLMVLVSILFSYQSKTKYVVEKIRCGLKWVFLFVLFLFLFEGIFYLSENAWKNVILNAPQAERVWWTVLEYAPNVSIYLTVGGLFLFILLNLFNLSSKVMIISLILNGLFCYAIIALILSFGMLSTPGTFMGCLGAFILLYVFAEDNLQRFIFAICGMFIVFSELFSSTGDITSTLIYMGGEPIFTTLERELSGTSEWIRFSSILFTISHVSMLAYAILFLKKSQKVLTFTEGDSNE